MKTEINARLTALRRVMRRKGFAAFVFPSTDPHQGEYVPDHWKGREWISGFDGSAGTAVVTMTSAALWTDSRYFIAAGEQLAETEFVLMKERIATTPSVSEWLAKELKKETCKKIGIDGWVCSHSAADDLRKALKKLGDFTLQTDFDPLAEIWNHRPLPPKDKIFLHPLQYAGETCSSKLRRIRKALSEQQAEGTIVSALDDVAWTLNLRGSDVHCNPVFVAYLFILEQKAVLYTDMEKISPEINRYLLSEGVETAPYEQIPIALAQCTDIALLLDSDALNERLFTVAFNARSIIGKLPIPIMKAVKNETEIRGFRNAMLRDGVAMVKFLKWLRPAVEAGGQTEITLGEKLTSLRSEQALYEGISFDTIVGYEAHGAIVHYEATPKTDRLVEPRGLVLIDSGAQYVDGTTDITRTIALGPVSEEQRKIYTLVLKGHIQLALCKFPIGVCGSQLDAFARQAMWREGYNFMHGTGHGVGSFLNVHEGPHQIRMEWVAAPLLPGMTVTNEPGIYLEGKFGVRIENTMLIQPHQQTAFGDFLGFDALTLAPIDTTPIDFNMLTAEEAHWLNSYHERVYRELSPYLTNEEQTWLKNATQPVERK